MAEKGRNTKQKTSIINYLRINKTEHQTADEIWSGLCGSGIRVGRATVYRALSTLTQEGIIKEYSLKGDSPSCFQYIGENSECNRHFHVVCDGCRRVVHFDSTPLSEALSAVQNENSFSIDERRTVFYGKCADCSTM